MRLTDLLPRLAAASLLALVACNGKDDEAADTDAPVTDADTDTDADADADTDTDTDSDTDADCQAVIDTVDPEPNNQLVPLDQVISVRFDSPILASDPWSLAVDGVSGSASLDGDMRGATFVPDAPLANDTLYMIDAAVCGDSAQASFRTLPPPVADADIEGITYAVAFDDVEITEPPNAALLETFLPIEYILVQVSEVDAIAQSIVAAGAVATLVDGVPEVDCGASVGGINVDFAMNPYFSMGPEVLFIDAGDVVVPIRDFTLLGRFSADGTEIVDVRVSGLVDLSQEPVGLNCQTVANLTNGTCLPCSQGAVTSDCLLLDAVAPNGPIDPRFDIDLACGF